MKRYLGLTLSIVVLAGLLFSCHRHPSIDGFEIEIENIEAGTSSVTIVGSYVYPGSASISSIMASIGRQSDFSDANEFPVTLEGQEFSLTVTGLESNTLYYYRFIVDYGGETDYYTEPDTFTTADFSLPIVRTIDASYVGPHEATCGGIVTDDGGFAVTARGVCYGTNPEPALDGLYTVDSCGLGVFESQLVGLEIGTQYYFRAYATNEKGTAYGDVKQFVTMAQSPTVRTLEIVSDGDAAVFVQAEVIADGGNAVTERGVCWSTTGEPSLDDNMMTNGSGLGIFTCHITDLQPNTTYYVRAFARNDVGLGFGETLQFTTGNPIVIPTVNTVEVSDVTAVSATCVCNVSNNGGAEITDRGACWGLEPNPSLSDSHASAGTGTGSYSVSLTGLLSNTVYYVRAYATNSQGTAYGEVFSFVTANGLPVVTTASVSDITATTAMGGGEVTNQGASAVTERGVCWSTEYGPTIEGNHASSGTGLGVFAVQMTGLTPNQVYFVRAYAINAQGVAYGSEVGFVAKEGLPAVSTVPVTDITANSAKCGGIVTDQGGSEVTVRGICWSTGHNPTMENSHVNSGSGLGGFICDMLGLTPGTTYYVRAYAVNEQGTVYGEEESFTTSVLLPEVTTDQVINITQTSAVGVGTVTSNGGATVTERGFCWSTSHSPTLNDNHASGGSGMGIFTVQMAGLETGTVYYVRAYAINSQGTAYGNELSFTTTANSPTVTTAQVSNITQTTALGGGNVTNDGGSMVTERGICWSTSHNPTVNGTHAFNGTGMGAFTVEMTGLSPNTTYYVRAYAINSAGISYGAEVSFTTTQNISAPTVTTSQIYNITQTTALGGGNVTNDGGATVTERGICWSTSPSPTIYGSHASSGSGTGAYTVQMIGLTPNTVYHVRAYAINSAGTSYGNEVTFTTSASIPSVTTAQVSNVSQHSALGGGNVTNSGGANVLERGICWSTSHNPTVSGSHAANGSGMGAFTVEMTGLNSSTTYYVRAYATNSAGTAYGNEVSFTTTHDISTPTVTTSAVTNITQVSATSGGNVTSDGGGTVTERGICWSREHNPTTSDNHANSGTGTGSFTVDMTDLVPGTVYYVRAYAINSAGTSYGNEQSFTTLEYLFPPTVTTSDVTNITQTTALGGGNVTNDGGAAVTERGLCWSTSHNPTINGTHANSGTGTGGFTVNMTGLTSNTTYYVRAYATNSQGTSYGDEVSFTSAQSISAPTVTTANVTNITQTSATGGGNVTADGGATVTERGICWSLNHNPTVSDNHANNGTGTGSYSVSMTDLMSNTTYYVRAYAVNSAGTSYGSEVSFTTASNPPTVTTSEVTNVTQTTATGGGNVTSDGGTPVTERGICWSTSHNPTVNSNHASSGTGTGSFTVSMSGLSTNTTYYVRAYAINSAGTSYGDEVSFTTMQNISAPTVTTSNVTNVTQTTATGGGNVTADGGATVTERGICWSTNHNPTVSNSHANSGTGTGSFTVNMSNLTPNTTYYVRAYATNSVGTSYGDEVSFTTVQSISAPTVTTSNVTNVTQTTATGGGNVISDGGATVTERGICWSASHNPTVSGTHATSGTGMGSFTLSMSGLSPNTTYYVRAYAINSAGTSYGDEVSFTTMQSISAPTVTTSDVTNVTQTTATGGGNVTADGGATVTERGICWSTSHNPTVSGTHANSGTGTGSFAVSMSGLSPNTTYYVRAYAINSAGTSYGDEVSFTTMSSVIVPTVTTSNVTNITQTTATGGGNVTSDGGATVTERGICWSTSHNPTVNDTHANSGTGTGSFTVSMSGLTEFTIYYVRAYAINSAGTSYGEEVAFITLSSGGNGPVGAINGLFSVSASEQVYFSQGNLQYQASTNTWRFANNQYDIVGQDNMYISSTNNGWIDLFGWGTSGYNHGAVCYQPWSTSEVESLYFAYGNPNFDLESQTGKADWGYNAISNGGGQENQWRTLTKEEWVYVINTRSTTSGIRYAKAIVNNVKGLLLLPDNWNASIHPLNNTNVFNSHYSDNVISASDWNIMQTVGVVFLPASGGRLGSNVFSYSEPNDPNAQAIYWSSTHKDVDGAYFVNISNASLSPSYNQIRYYGLAVRVVRVAE